MQMLMQLTEPFGPKESARTAELATSHQFWAMVRQTMSLQLSLYALPLQTMPYFSLVLACLLQTPGTVLTKYVPIAMDLKPSIINRTCHCRQEHAVKRRCPF